MTIEEDNKQVIQQSLEGYKSDVNENNKELWARQIGITSIGYISNRGSDINDWLTAFAEYPDVCEAIKKENNPL